MEDESIKNIEEKIRFLLRKKGIYEPNADDYSAKDMRHFFADKRKYKNSVDLFHNEIASGRIDI